MPTVGPYPRRRNRPGHILGRFFQCTFSKCTLYKQHCEVASWPERLPDADPRVTIGSANNREKLTSQETIKKGARLLPIAKRSRAIERVPKIGMHAMAVLIRLIFSFLWAQVQWQ